MKIKKYVAFYARGVAFFKKGRDQKLAATLLSNNS
jgi:hypothetical protein